MIGPGVTPDANRALESSYKLLATYLAVLAPEGTRTRERFADEIGRELPELRPRVTLLCAAGATDALVTRMRETFTANAVARWPNLDVDDARINRAAVVRCLERTESLVVPATLATLASSRVKDAVREARRQGRCVYLVHDGALRLSNMPAWARFGATLLDAHQSERMVAAVTAPCRSDRVPMMAPGRPTPYIERAEARTLREMVLPGSADGAATPRPGRVVVAGLGGTGKTALVLALCAEDAILDAFEGGVLWLTLGPSPDPVALRLELYQALIAPSASPPAASVSAELQRHLRERRVLLVLDDARDGVIVRELAGVAPRAVVVITTRDAAVLVPQTAARLDPRETGPVSMARQMETADGQPQATVLALGPMRAAEAEALLAALVHGASGAPASTVTNPLAEALGYLPLAVSLAGARLRQRAEGASPADVAGEIDRLTETLNQRRFSEVEAGWRQQVLLPVSRVLTETMAAISREDRRRLETWAKQGELVESPARLARLWSVTDADVGDVIGRLAPRSLVVVRPDGGYERSALASAVLVAGLTATADAEVARRPNGSELRRKNPDVALANRVLGGQALPAADLLALAKRLAATRIFDLSRRVLATARTQSDARSDPALMRVLTQRQALCTYKDRDLEPDRRFDWALSLLAELGPLDSTTDQETLGLAGAIHKNRWLLDGQRRHLERSLASYRRGLDQGIEKDYGYTAINVAFVHDLLAWETAQAGSGAIAGDGVTTDSEHTREAHRIREQIASRLPPLVEAGGQSSLGVTWWFNATVAEACFGLDRYDDALAWIRRGQASPIDAWEYESTARQLAWLARIRHAAKPDSPAAGAAQNVLRGLLGGDPAALSGLFLGKVGLALSGGGFRASLFHIGVLARLADMDLLRHVEVLSCVSGGSIIGAHYYLKIRALLKDKTDGEIRREDYQRVIAELIDEFLAGVQENIRLRVAASPGAALKMAVSADYSRTDRLGELYERHLYARVQDGEGAQPRFISDLTITPKGDPDCSPESDNWRRAAKVPMLVLNATSLNTAHNWQFTATWMGEPPDLLTTEIDANPRLERLYYWEAPERHQKVRLGAAVAASSCVPALFEPLSLRGLYPERRVQLVDGGVHDNQGLSALIEAQCAVTLVSDASGQTSEVLRPGTGTIGVLSRTNAILQGRVREASLRDLLARVRGGLVRGLMFLHLKRDLAADPVGHKGRLDQPEAPGAVTGVKGALTSYGILREVQKRLAALRTDLDSFGDGEAFALMLSGYRMAQHDVPVMLRSLPGAPAASEGPAGRWRFFEIEPAATGAPGSEHAVAWLQDVLSVGSAISFKVWRLHRWLSLAATVAIATLVVGAALALPYALSGLLPAWRLSTTLGLVALVVLLPVGLFVAHRLRKSSKSFGQIRTGASARGRRLDRGLAPPRPARRPLPARRSDSAGTWRRAADALTGRRRRARAALASGVGIGATVALPRARRVAAPRRADHRRLRDLVVEPAADRRGAGCRGRTSLQHRPRRRCRDDLSHRAGRLPVAAGGGHGPEPAAAPQGRDARGREAAERVETIRPVHARGSRLCAPQQPQLRRRARRLRRRARPGSAERRLAAGARLHARPGRSHGRRHRRVPERPQAPAGSAQLRRSRHAPRRRQSPARGARRLPRRACDPAGRPAASRGRRRSRTPDAGLDDEPGAERDGPAARARGSALRDGQPVQPVHRHPGARPGTG